ncbi:MAG: InlB B-repeat-containing protein [Bacteroidota bacterium]
MKKIIISLLAGTLLSMSGFSQIYEYTDSTFVQVFEEDEPLDKSGSFIWSETTGSGPTLTAEGLTSTAAFEKSNAAGVSFNKNTLDISPENPDDPNVKGAWVAFEAKASDNNVKIHPQLKSEGAFTTKQHTVNLTTEWQIFKLNFFPTTFGDVDISKITRFEFATFKEADYEGETLYVKWLSVGDTSAASLLAPKYALDIEETEGGSVTRDPDANEYEEGTEVTLTATPIRGYSFTGWTEDTTASDSIITITMNEDKSITANFEYGASVNENVLPGLVNVYPNPADDVLYISGLEGNSSAVISDLTGKTILEIQDDNIDEIDISGLTSGMYMLTCSNDKGILNKIIIKK